MKCNVCDKEMTMPDGSFSHIGVAVNIQIEEGVAPERAEWMIKQAHPYKVNNPYYVCWVCWLASMGIKP